METSSVLQPGTFTAPIAGTGIFDQPSAADQLNLTAVTVAQDLGDQLAPKAASVIDELAASEPVIFHLLMALLHSRRQVNKAATAAKA